MRFRADLGAHLEPGSTHVQVALVAVEMGYLWGWVGTDGTSAPYFDNVAVKAIDLGGPAILARAIDLPQDTFPRRGQIDLGQPAENYLNFDQVPEFLEAADKGRSLAQEIVVQG